MELKLKEDEELKYYILYLKRFSIKKNGYWNNGKEIKKWNR